MEDIPLVCILAPIFKIYDREYPADMDNTPRPATPLASDTVRGGIEEGETPHTCSRNWWCLNSNISSSAFSLNFFVLAYFSFHNGFRIVFII